MMKKITKDILETASPQYIVDKKGKKTSVVFDMKTFEHFLDSIEDVCHGALAQARLELSSERISHEAVVRRFKKSKK